MIDSSDYPSIQAALDAAGAAGGGAVRVPPGTHPAQLVLPSRVMLCGHGVATVIAAPVGATGAVITHAPHAVLCAVRDLAIDGGTQAIDGLCLGAAEPYDADLDALYDPRHSAADLFIRHCGGAALRCAGRGQMLFTRVWAYQCGYGFVTSYDNTFVACDAGESDASGFVVNGSSVRLVGCKAWWSGQHDPGADAYGFHLLACRGAQLSACSAQDNGRAGFLLDGCQHVVMAACDADSNGRGGGDADVGFDLWQTTACMLTACVAWERGQTPDHPQRAALRLRQGCTGNSIALISDHPGQGRPLAANSDDTTGNAVTILHNGMPWLP